MSTAGSRRVGRGGRAVMLALALCGGLAACATASPTPQAQRVIPVNGVPAGCQNLGTVIGESEATHWGSGEPTAEQLASQATADAMERAARLGATHIFPSPVTIRQKDGKPFTATQTGVAFRCGRP